MDRLVTLYNEIKEELVGIFPEHLRDKLTLKNILYRIINILLFGILFSIYIYVPFIGYMAHYGFFAYDFFVDQGIFAINVFSIFIVFFAISFSFIVTGGLGIVFACKLIKMKMFKANWYLIGMNVLILSLLLILTVEMYEDSQKYYQMLEWYIFLVLLSLIVSTHISIVINIYSSVKHQLLSTFFTFCILLPVFFFVIFPVPSAKLVSNTLATFGVGGNIKVAIIDKANNNKCSEGELVFLSPENIYFKNHNNVIIIIKRENYAIGLANEVKCSDNSSKDVKEEGTKNEIIKDNSYVK
jgi:hypothetical protein